MNFRGWSLSVPLVDIAVVLRNGDVKMSDKALSYYSSQSAITHPGRFKRLYKDLPEPVGDLCKVCQNVLIHKYRLKYSGPRSYRITFEDVERTGRVLADEYNLVKVEDTLACHQSLGSGSIVTERRPIDRVVGNCRHFAVLLTSFLRHRGTPARVRSGVATYLTPERPGFFMDHFITEYWDRTEARWILVDPQIDTRQRQDLRIDFDTNDIPRDRFIVGGVMWRLYREKKVDPNKFGIFGYTGPGYVQFKVVNDIVCLNKEEVLPWDGWGLAAKDFTTLTKPDLRRLDSLSGLSAAIDNSRFDEMRAAYESNGDLRKPSDYKHLRWTMPK